MPDEADLPAGTEVRSHTGVTALATGWLDAVGHRFRTGAALALAETRLALSSFLLMLFLTVLAAGALLFAWGFLAYGVMQGLISAGYSPLLTTVAVVAVHVLLAWLLWLAVQRLGRNMEFTQTRRLFASSDVAAEGVDE